MREEATNWWKQANYDFETAKFDLIIVSKDFNGLNFLERIRKIAVEWNEDVVLEPLCYTSEEFEKKCKQVCIVQKAVKEGIEI